MSTLQTQDSMRPIMNSHWVLQMTVCYLTWEMGSCLCVFVHVCACTSEYMHIYVQIQCGKQVKICVFLGCFPLYIFWVGSLAEPGTLAYWLANMLQRSACLCSPHSGITEIHSHGWLLCGFWKTRSHAGVASILPSESFPQAQKRDSCRCMQCNGLGIILSCLRGYTVNSSVLITANPALWQESHMETSRGREEMLCHSIWRLRKGLWTK